MATKKCRCGFSVDTSWSRVCKACGRIFGAADVVATRIVRRTPEAILIQDDSGVEGWIPRSQIEAMSEPACPGGLQVVITIPSWLAASRGFKSREALAA